MDDLERFVSDGNISRLIDRLAEGPEAKERAILAQLLVHEEARFAKEVERFELVQRWIDRCDGHLTRQRALSASNSGPPMMQMTIHITEEIKRTLISFRRTWEINVNDAAKFADKF